MSDLACCSCVQRLSVQLPKQYDFALVAVVEGPIYTEVTTRCSEVRCLSCGQMFYAGTWDALVLSEEGLRQFQQSQEHIEELHVLLAGSRLLNKDLKAAQELADQLAIALEYEVAKRGIARPTASRVLAAYEARSWK